MLCFVSIRFLYAGSEGAGVLLFEVVVLPVIICPVVPLSIVMFSVDAVPVVVFSAVGNAATLVIAPKAAAASRIKLVEKCMLMILVQIFDEIIG